MDQLSNVPTDLTPVCTLLPRLPSNSDGSNEAEEEAVLQGTLHVPVHSTSKGIGGSTVVEIERPTPQRYSDQQ